VQVFQTHLDANPVVKAAVEEVTRKCKEEAARPTYQDSANVAAKSAILGALGGGGGLLAGGIAGLKLKKTTTNHKTMFGDLEGKVKEGGGGGKDAAAGADKRKALSKLVDFPGVLAEIKAHLEDVEGVNPAGRDFYGLTALQKFASWNKTEFMDLLIPKLTQEELNATDKEGKTALHWAVEMAAVASVKTLVKAGIDVDAKNAKGHTVGDVLEQAGDSGVIERLKKAVRGE
jgi:hypothetical protein